MTKRKAPKAAPAPRSVAGRPHRRRALSAAVRVRSPGRYGVGVRLLRGEEGQWWCNTCRKAFDPEELRFDAQCTPEAAPPLVAEETGRAPSLGALVQTWRLRPDHAGSLGRLRRGIEAHQNRHRSRAGLALAWPGDRQQAPSAPGSACCGTDHRSPARSGAAHLEIGRMTTFKSLRARAWRNVMVAGINAGLNQDVFGLALGQDHWDRVEGWPENAGVFTFAI